MYVTKQLINDLVSITLIELHELIIIMYPRLYMMMTKLIFGEKKTKFVFAGTGRYRLSQSYKVFLGFLFD